MRITIEDFHNHPEMHDSVEVRLNGEIQHCCIEADEEQGYIIKYFTHKTGLAIPPGNVEFIQVSSCTVKIYGKVSIKINQLLVMSG